MYAKLQALQVLMVGPITILNPKVKVLVLIMIRIIMANQAHLAVVTAGQVDLAVCIIT